MRGPQIAQPLRLIAMKGQDLSFAVFAEIRQLAQAHARGHRHGHRAQGEGGV